MSSDLIDKLSLPEDINLPYTLTLEDSDDFARYYTILSGIEDLEFNPDKSLLNENASEVTYENAEVLIKLIGNFQTDTYKLIVEEA